MKTNLSLFIACAALLDVSAHAHPNHSRDGEPIWQKASGWPDRVIATLAGDPSQSFALDSSGIAFDEQLAWLESEVRESDATWKVLTMHHPLFSFVGGTEHPAHKERRMAILNVFKKRLLDLVLTGHRHTYQRGTYGDDVARFGIGEARSVDTVFVVTASSTKRGWTKVEGWDEYAEDQGGVFKLNRHADNIPLFAVFDVDESELAYRAVDATGEVYDAFTLSKGADGQKRIEDGGAAKGPIKDRSNTGRYISWDDLR